MIRFLFNLIGLLIFAFIACVLYMYIFLHMSVSQAVHRIINAVTSTVSSVRVDVPDHLSHTPSTAADNQLKRINSKL